MEIKIYGNKTYLIVLGVAVLAGIFIAGYYFGFSSAMNLFISKAAEFVKIDKALIINYLAKAGLNPFYNCSLGGVC